jgi:hypothetical protein
VFAVTRLLGAPEGPFADWEHWLVAHAALVVDECAVRSIQTNEPQRCAVLLPALGLVDGPIALLEVGASAGLCLYPDRYSYRYRRGDEVIALDPPGGASRVVLSCDLEGRPPLRMPEIVWRAGIDLQPRDAADPGDRAWLTGLVWPGEAGRADRVAAALDVVAADPPLLVAGDAVETLPALAAQAPRDATLVVTTPGVLAHVPRARRGPLIDRARAAGRWITLDDPGLHDGWTRSARARCGYPAEATSGANVTACPSPTATATSSPSRRSGVVTAARRRRRSARSSACRPRATTSCSDGWSTPRRRWCTTLFSCAGCGACATSAPRRAPHA